MRSSLSLYLGQSYGLKIILTALLSLNGRPKPGEKSLQILAENNKVTAVCFRFFSIKNLGFNLCARLFNKTSFFSFN